MITFNILFRFNNLSIPTCRIETHKISFKFRQYMSIRVTIYNSQLFSANCFFEHWQNIFRRMSFTSTFEPPTGTISHMAWYWGVHDIDQPFMGELRMSFVSNLGETMTWFGVNKKRLSFWIYRPWNINSNLLLSRPSTYVSRYSDVTMSILASQLTGDSTVLTVCLH